ncbi:MAG: 50S ribosomal protein L35 [Clostridiales bacterium GWF2_36_10]|nr:MAG: 50S ribosomal protein L35 [Clostridiales bacterium GWF2_36_10]HAN20392.1 50S ribosomal protein L35 [Clostridiales bacterium]
MGKMKTHKATAKRFSFTANDKIKMNHSGRRHKLGLKATKRKRILRKAGYVSSARMNDLKRLLPYD